jgi:putative hydrolase of the HAD superfamily
MQASNAVPRRAVLLDALGTLVRMHDPSAALCSLLHERHDVAVELPDARRAMVAEMTHYKGSCLQAADAVKLAALRLECASILRAQLAPALNGVAAEQLVPTLLDALHFEPFADAIPALRRWGAAGLKRIVVSNWDVSLHDVLRSTGLRPLLDGVVCSAEVGCSKPDPALFAAGLQLAGVAPMQAVHIGDSLDEDVAGARAAGIEPLLLLREGAATPVPVGVRTLASLREW